MSDFGHRIVVAIELMVGMVSLGGAADSAMAAPTETRLSGQSVRQFVGVGAGPGNYAVVAWVAAPPGVGTGPNGDLKQGPSRVMVAVRSRKGKGFGRPRRISPFNAQVASLAVSETGKTMVVWANSKGKIRARYRTPNRGWSKAMRVAGDTASPDIPSLDISEDGTAVVGWRNNRKRHPGAQMVAMYRPGLGFRKSMRVGPKWKLNHPSWQGDTYAVSARDGGKGTAVWTSSCGWDPKFFQPGWSVILDIKKGATRPAKIPSSKCPHNKVSLSENSRGKAVLAINGYTDASIVRVAVRPAGKRRFRKAVRISPKGVQSSFADVKVHANGSVSLVAPVYKNNSHMGLVGLDFFMPREGMIGFDHDLIAPPTSAFHAVGANDRGDVAVLSQNVDTRMWDFTSKRANGPYSLSIQLPFDNFQNKSEMAGDLSAVAVGRSGKAVAAAARTNWTGVDRTSGHKGIYVFEGLPGPSK